MRIPKVGLYISSVFPAVDRDVFRALDLAAELGFRGVCLSHTNTSPLGDLSPPERRRAVQDAPRNLGLEVSALSCNISSQTEGGVGQRMAPLVEALDLAAESGVPTVIVHGGERLVDDEAENQRAWQRLVENLTYAGAHAADKGVTVSMEPGGGVWMVHGWRLLARLRDEVGESFKVNLDPANILMACEDPAAGVRELGEAIVHLHIKDAAIVRPAEHAKRIVAGLDPRATNLDFAAWKAALAADCGEGGNFWRETPVGDGEVDFRALFAALDETGFRRWAAIEREGRGSGEERVAEVRKAREHVLSLA